MRVFLVGIGGIGMSALARYYLSEGFEVLGSDLEHSEIIEELEREGIKVFIGHNKENLPSNLDLLVFSQAVPKDSNPEIQEALRRGVKVLTYPQAVGEITKKKETIAVAGSHGKGTTLAFLTLIFLEAKLDPTVIIGTKLKELGNLNFRKGSSKWLLLEADEFSGAFLNYYPKIAVLTNIDLEHLEFFGTLERELEYFKKFGSNVDPEGALIVNFDDPNCIEVSKAYSGKVISFSLKDKEIDKVRKVLKLKGIHNLYNALAAFKVAKFLSLEEKIILKAISKFEGAWRRFQKKESKGILFITDYAHHPTELKFLIQAAKEEFPHKKIALIFQPHQIERFKILKEDFKKLFLSLPVHKLILTDVYLVPGRDKEEDPALLSKRVIQELSSIEPSKFFYLPFKPEELLNFIFQNFNYQWVVLLVGAGNIYNVFKKLP